MQISGVDSGAAARTANKDNKVNNKKSINIALDEINKRIQLLQEQKQKLQQRIDKMDTKKEPSDIKLQEEDELKKQMAELDAEISEAMSEKITHKDEIEKEIEKSKEHKKEDPNKKSLEEKGFVVPDTDTSKELVDVYSSTAGIYKMHNVKINLQGKLNSMISDVENGYHSVMTPYKSSEIEKLESNIKKLDKNIGKKMVEVNEKLKNINKIKNKQKENEHIDSNKSEDINVRNALSNEKESIQDISNDNGENRGSQKDSLTKQINKLA